MKKFKYFSEWDFQRANPKCSIKDMDSQTLHMFDIARELAGIPFIVNSAYRDLAHEHSRGRDGSSSHVSGKAMDIRCQDSRSRFLIVNALIQAGFDRIGIANTFIHADNDESKDDRVIWFY